MPADGHKPDADNRHTRLQSGLPGSGRSITDVSEFSEASFSGKQSATFRVSVEYDG